MSIFFLPTSLVLTIESMMNSTWWGHGSSNNCGIHLMSWKNLEFLKLYGGMGFEDLDAFNLAMFAKLGWKFQMEPDSLVSHCSKLDISLT